MKADIAITRALKSINRAVSKVINSKPISFIATIIFGIIGVIPYYSENLFFFTFISLFLLFYVIDRRSKVKSSIFFYYFGYFTGFFAPLYLFLSELYPYERFGFTSTQAIFIVICSCIFIPLIHTLVVALVMGCSRYFNDGWQSVLSTASLWVIAEWALTLGTLAFPWGNTAVSLTGFLPYLQTASLFGKSFITFVTVAGCYALAKSASERKRLYALIGAGVVLINSAVGTVLYFLPSENADTVTVAAIQGNILSNEKWDSDKQGSIFDRYINLTEDAAENGAEIILIPESAIPVYFVKNGSLQKAFSNIATRYDVTIIAGVSTRNDDGIYNSVVAILPDGSVSERYDKRHLVPFGEFMPFADVLGQIVPFVGEFNESSSDYLEGDKAVVINTPYGDVTPLVCFDSIFPQFASDGCRDGAEYIAVVTNDSWFNDSAGIYTHLRHAQIRAIENKKYVMRAANTGVSAFIDGKGNIIAASEPLTVDTVYADICPSDGKTLYTRCGDLFLYVSYLIVITLTIINLIRRKKNGNNPSSRKRNI